MVYGETKEETLRGCCDSSDIPKVFSRDGAVVQRKITSLEMYSNADYSETMEDVQPTIGFREMNSYSDIQGPMQSLWLRLQQR